MINTSYQNYGIFASQEPQDSDLRQAYDVFKVKNILSLDRNAAQRVKERIERLKLPIKQVVFHIDPGSPSGQATTLFNNILSYINKFPVLVHCQAGKDRTGFAIASWLIKTGKYNPCGAVAAVTQTIGYGTGGISTTAKNSMDRILGCMQEEAATSNEQELTTDEATDLIDNMSVDDIVDQMRDGFAHQQQSGGAAGTVDGGWMADNVRFNNWSDPTREIYPGNYEYQMNGPTMNVADVFASNNSDIIKRSSLRKKVLKKIIQLLKELKKEDNNDVLEGGPALMEGDLLGPELPSGVGPFPGIPKQNNVMGVGELDNYTGLGGNYLNNPSGAPGAGNAASNVEPVGFVQL